MKLGKESFFECAHFWDPVEARLEPCAIRVLPFACSIVAATVAIWAVISPFLRPYVPRWLRNFVPEDQVGRADTDHAPKAFLTLHWAYGGLLIFTAIGLIAQTTDAFLPRFSASAGFLGLSWLLSLVILLATKPRTVPFALSLLYLCIATCHLGFVLTKESATTTLERSTSGCCIVCLVCIFVIIMCMPFRDPRLARSHIARASDPPGFHNKSPEDDITLGQFLTVSWVYRLLQVGNSRQIQDEDVWSLGFEFQHQGLHDRFRRLQGSVIKRLLIANGLDCVILTLFGIVNQLATFSAPLLLQQLLQAMENPHAPIRAAVVYATLSLAVRLISAQTAVTALWYCRRCYERSRGEMITMLYEKTLRRKFRVSAPEDPDSAGAEQEVPASDGGKEQSTVTKVLNHVSQLLACSSCFGKRASKRKPEEKQAASTGKILNLMRNDVYEVAQRFWEVEDLVNVPLSVILSTVLVWRLMGWSCLVGVVTVLVAQAGNAIVAKVLLHFERKRRVRTDSRLQISSQVVECIRHLRYYGWQQTWIARIMKQRQEELNLRIVTALWNILISFNNTLASGLFPVVAFYAYTALAGERLRLDIAFPAIQLFAMLDESLRDLPSLITVLLNATVAVGRIEEFMKEPNKDDGEGDEADDDTGLFLKNASFAWPGNSRAVVEDVTLSFPKGLTVIHGKVAAGKTALLHALLGEMDILSGRRGSCTAMVAYCGQTPWLESMSIRDNILFASPFDVVRYKQVLDACALTVDLASFKHGDLSNIGENGIGLSGGQKARVALARAVYSHAPILMLDDPISALDHQTAEHVMQKCLSGPLVDGRTTILVTHRVQLCRGLAQQTVEVADGHVKAEHQDILLETQDETASSSGSSEPAQADKSVVDESMQDAAVPEAFIEEEHRATGGVKARVYWQYVKAGKYRWWALLVCVLVVFRLVVLAKTWVLKEWGEAYTNSSSSLSSKSNSSKGFLDGFFDDFPSPEADVRPWLLCFLAIAVAQAVAFLIARSMMLVIVYSAGKTMFQQIVQRVCHATFRFYDVTPVGRLMNRLTGDIGTVDGNISDQFQQLAFQIITWVSSVAVIAATTPLFFVFALAMTLAFIYYFRIFLPTSQSLRRLEMVSLSPLMTNFGALVHGLLTVRAFRAQDRFQARNVAVTDAFQRMDHFFWSVQAWLVYRFEMLAALSTFLLTLLALYTNVSAGLVAFTLTAAATFVSSTNGLCRQYGQLQMDFVSVERVVELLQLEQEPPGTIEPPASWPSMHGDIVLEDVTIRYAPHLDPALSNLSLRIKGGASTAIIGRTGSGKSTLVTALLATTPPEHGRILIDGIDIARVDKQTLRQRVTFLAQDPLLFPGTLRENLDPLREHDEAAVSSVLSRVCAARGWTPGTRVDAGGANLSQGERQLVGLARAVLRRSPIVILDEATASIDMESALEIQQVLRDEMRSSTVITIAHRVEAVRGADFAVMLAGGTLARAGPAGELLATEGGAADA